MQFMKEDAASENVKADEELFYQAFEASPIGMALEDMDGRPLHVNPALCSMLGYSEEEMRCKHCTDLSPPEDAQKDWALFQQLRAGTIDRYSLEKRFFRKDGGLTWGRLSISRLDHRPSPLIVAMVEDITPLRENEKRFRSMADAAPVMIWMSGPDALATYVNQSWLAFTGRTVEEELGSGWSEGIHADDRQRSMETYMSAFDRRQPFSMEYRLRRNDGEYRWILDSGVPRYDPAGSFTGYIGSAVDVTERKKAEEAILNLGGRLIEAQEQERRRLARELHDDISQKLAMLSLDLQQFAGLFKGADTTLRDRINSLIKRNFEVTEDLRTLSHQLHSSRLETVGLIAAMRGFCRELAEQRNVQIEFRNSGVPENLPETISLCLFRVLQESLTNAVKHSGERQFVARLERVSDELHLTVQDFGVGFEPGVAMYNDGIGLISMRERVNLVKGTLSILSRPQRGTEIRVRVPIPAAKSMADVQGV
jgi:PAS domain S-box-containing protein